MRAINLLPQDEQRARFEGGHTPLFVAAGGIAAVTAAAFVLGLSSSGAGADRRDQLESIEAAIARLPRVPESAVSQGALVQERSDRMAALSAALSSRVSFDRLLRQISLVLPEDAWLTGFKAELPENANPPAAPSSSAPTPSSTAPQEVTIEGATYSQASVARVLSRLSVIPSLTDVLLTASTVVEPQPEALRPGEAKATPPRKKAKRIITFTISASLRTGTSS